MLGTVFVLSAATDVYVASAGSAVPGCTTVGAVGISSATVDIPATRGPSRYVASVTTDNVPNPPYPQIPSITEPLIQFSNTMNPAAYNNNALGGVVDVWDSVNHVSTALPKSKLTASAADPGGIVRVSVWICPE
jgi:hypothetical protein